MSTRDESKYTNNPHKKASLPYDSVESLSVRLDNSGMDAINFQIKPK